MNLVPTTSDAILASARSFILTGGYSAFSYADIAGVVGIRKASIHHHFPSKVDLVRTLLQHYRADAETGLTQLAASSTDPVAALTAYTGMWSRCIGDGSIPFCVCALLAAELPALPPELAAEVREYFRFLSSWLAAILQQGAERGLLRLENPAEIEAESFMAIVHGAMLSARAQGKPLLFGAIVNPMLRRLSVAAN